MRSADPAVEKPARSVSQVVLLATAFAVLIAISFASIYLVNRSRELSAMVVHTIEVENQISLSQLQMRRAESAVRGYLLTGSESYLADFTEASALTVPAVEKLGEISADNPVQQKNIAIMLPMVRARIDDFKRMLELSQSGRQDDALQSMRTGGGSAMNNVRQVATEMRAEEDRLFALRNDEADRSQLLAAIVTTSGSALVLVLAGISIFLVRRSVRARDNAEEQLRQNNLNLETKVTERTADLREANEEIQRFAYIVSHDLRSPLVNIMGFTSELEQLRPDIFGRISHLSQPAEATAPPANDRAEAALPLEEKDQQLSTEYSEAIGFIKSSIGKMDRLITAILNLTREGRREFHPVRIETRDLIENIVSTVAHQASEAQAQIRIEPLPNVVSDRLSLEQIFSNLIDNALKYLKPGIPGDISIRGRHKLGFAVFEVIDNGRGIDPKDHQRIFDLFRRAGTQDKPGQGIGLAHVRALVRRMGGTMSVASELGRGSTFTVTLPAMWPTQIKGSDA